MTLPDRELMLHQQEVQRDRDEEAKAHGFRRYQPKLIQWDEEEAPRNYNRRFANGDDNGEA